MNIKEICLFCFNVVMSGAIAGVSGSLLKPFVDSHEWLFAACGVVGYMATMAAEFGFMFVKEHYRRRP